MDDILFNFSNCYWISGILFLIVGSLYKSSRIITKQDLDVEVLLYIVEKYKPTTVFSVPYMIAELLQSKNLKAMDSIKCVITGGAPVSATLSERLNKFLPNGKISIHYGYTEISGIITDSGGRLDTVGQLAHNIEMKVNGEEKEVLPFLNFSL